MLIFFSYVRKYFFRSFFSNVVNKRNTSFIYVFVQKFKQISAEFHMHFSFKSKFIIFKMQNKKTSIQIKVWIVWISFALNDWFLKVYINFSPASVIWNLERFIIIFFSSNSKIVTSLPMNYAWKFNSAWFINYTEARGLTHTHFSSREMVLNVKNRRHPIKQLIKIYRFREFINLFAAKNYIQKKNETLDG